MAVTLLAAASCAPEGTTDDDEVVTTQSALLGPMPAFPFEHLPMEIKNVATNKCLDGSVPGAAVQRTCSGAKGQTWFLIKSGGGNAYQLRASSAGMMLLYVNGASTADGAGLTMYGEDRVTPEATYTFDSQTGGSFRLQTFAAKRAEVKNGDTSDAVVLQQATCIANDKQQWRVTPKYPTGACSSCPPASVVRRLSERAVINNAMEGRYAKVT